MEDSAVNAFQLETYNTKSDDHAFSKTSDRIDMFVHSKVIVCE
jgi:hypothetical protein